MIAGAGLWVYASLLSLVLDVRAMPAEDYEYDYPDVQPVFLSSPGSYRVKEGESIVLPCEINNLGPYPVVWRKGRRVISAGQTITAIDRRFQLVRGHDLQITRARVKDTGTFTCSLSTEPMMELTHSVDILCWNTSWRRSDTYRGSIHNSSRHPRNGRNIRVCSRQRRRSTSHGQDQSAGAISAGGGGGEEHGPYRRGPPREAGLLRVRRPPCSGGVEPRGLAAGPQTSRDLRGRGPGDASHPDHQERAAGRL